MSNARKIIPNLQNILIYKLIYIIKSKYIFNAQNQFISMCNQPCKNQIHSQASCYSNLTILPCLGTLTQEQQERANSNRTGDFLSAALELSSQVHLSQLTPLLLKQFYSLSWTYEDAALH